MYVWNGKLSQVGLVVQSPHVFESRKKVLGSIPDSKLHLFHLETIRKNIIVPLICRPISMFKRRHKITMYVWNGELSHSGLVVQSPLVFECRKKVLGSIPDSKKTPLSSCVNYINKILQ